MPRPDPSDPIPLHRKARRASDYLGPSEAAQIASAARLTAPPGCEHVRPTRGRRSSGTCPPGCEHSLAPGSAKDLLAFLLRFSRAGRGFTTNFTRARLQDELGTSWRTVTRAIRALECSGLVEVHRGTGRQVTQYVINPQAIADLLGERPEVWWGPAEGCQNDTPEVSERHPTGVKATPQGCQSDEPYTRVRVRDVRAALQIPSLPLVPTAAEPSPPPVVESPAVPAGPPLRNPTGNEGQCEHGRTPAQGGCRKCGTTARQAGAERAARELLEQAEARRAAQLEDRERRRRERANAPPPPSDLLAETKKQIHANRYPTQGETE